MITEAFELGLEDLLDGPPDDGLTHIDGQGLDGIEVDVEPRTFVPISTSGDDFPPPVSHVAKFRTNRRTDPWSDRCSRIDGNPDPG